LYAPAGGMVAIGVSAVNGMSVVFCDICPPGSVRRPCDGIQSY
jgi:hypothetical protein